MSTDLHHLYETDLYAWAIRNAALLRAGELDRIDPEHIAEELESMGRSERRALESRLSVLLMHLLKWRHQSALRGTSWRATIKEQRLQVNRLLRDNPSLQAQLPTLLPEAYESAVLKAVRETGLGEANFPRDCPFTPDQALDAEFWPD